MATQRQIDELGEIEEQEVDAPTCRSCGRVEGTNSVCEECQSERRAAGEGT